MDALANLPAAEQRSLAEAAKRGEKVSAITAHSGCDPETPKQDIDRLAKFKRRTVDREAVWVCEQLELAWCALLGELFDRGLSIVKRITAASAINLHP